MKKDNQISKRIKELRVARGLSKSELARQTGVTPTAVWNWEDTHVVPRSNVFPLIAKALDVTEAFLRTGGESPDPKRASRTVSVVIEDARKEISELTGMPLAKVRMSVEFVDE